MTNTTSNVNNLKWPSMFLVSKTANPLLVKQWVLDCEPSTRHDLCALIFYTLYQTSASCGNHLSSVEMMINHPLIKFRPSYDTLLHLTQMPIGQTDIAVYLLTNPTFKDQFSASMQNSVLRQAIFSKNVKVLQTLLEYHHPTNHTLMCAVDCFMKDSRYKIDDQSHQMFFCLLEQLKHKEPRELEQQLVSRCFQHQSLGGLQILSSFVAVDFLFEQALLSNIVMEQRVLRFFDSVNPSLLMDIAQRHWQHMTKMKDAAPSLYVLAERALLTEHANTNKTTITRKM